MNVLWSSMLLLGIVYGAIQGRMPEVTDGVIRAFAGGGGCWRVSLGWGDRVLGGADGDCEEGGSD